MKTELKAIHDFNDETRAYILEQVGRVVTDENGLALMGAEDWSAYSEFLLEENDRVLVSLYECLKKAVSDTPANFNDVPDLDEVVDALDYFETHDAWDTIADASEELGYNAFQVAVNLKDGDWFLIDDVAGYSDLGWWYFDEFVASEVQGDPTAELLSRYIDFEQWGRDISLDGVTILRNSGCAINHSSN